jgi:hypothetical protein
MGVGTLISSNVTCLFANIRAELQVTLEFLNNVYALASKPRRLDGILPNTGLFMAISGS